MASSDSQPRQGERANTLKQQRKKRLSEALRANLTRRKRVSPKPEQK